MVEAADASVGPAGLVARARDTGAEILTGHAAVRAEGGTDGVEALVVHRIDAGGQPVAGSERRIGCDTVVLGIAAVPTIELLEAAGCRTVFDPARGGHAPVLDDDGATSRPGLYAVGDAAGVWAGKLTDPAVAEAEGRRAVAAIVGNRDASPAAQPDDPADLDGDLKRWVRASVVAGGDAYVCQCEEVTAREILEVRPPRYLGWKAPARSQKPADLPSLLGNGPASPDQVKRLTRAGMGPCQGRRCREQVAVLLALESGAPLSEIPLASYRMPVRPLPLDRFSTVDEPPEVAENWEGWFGIPSMWLAPWELGPDGRVPAEEGEDG